MFANEREIKDIPYLRGQKRNMRVKNKSHSCLESYCLRVNAFISFELLAYSQLEVSQHEEKYFAFLELYIKFLRLLLYIYHNLA